MSLCLFSLALLVISEVGYWCLTLEEISTLRRKIRTLVSLNLARSARFGHVTHHRIDLQWPYTVSVYADNREFCPGFLGLITWACFLQLEYYTLFYLVLSLNCFFCLLS